MLTPVVIESPYAGDVTRNIIYARRAVRDCLQRDEAPIASHLLFTQIGILDDKNSAERKLGMNAGFVWTKFAHRVVVYMDYGESHGMVQGINTAHTFGIPVERRYIGPNP